MKPETAPMDRTSWCATLLLAVLVLAFVYPFLWMFFSAFKDNREIFRPLQLLPARFDWQYCRQLLEGEWIPFGRVFLNSCGIALVKSIGAVAAASLAGYAFARGNFRGKGLAFALALVVIVLPPAAMAVPLFSWLNQLRLIDSVWGVILPGMVSGLGVVYFTVVFRQIPNELVDAARLAGASEFRVYLTLLPLIRAALLAFGMIEFILAWHEHLLPMLVLSSEANQTLPVALAGLYGSSLRFPYAVLMAGSVLAVLPTAVLFLLLHKKFKTALSEVLLH